MDLKIAALLGWDLEAMPSNGGILLVSPVLQWDLDRAAIEFIILNVLPMDQDPTQGNATWEKYVRTISGDGGIGEDICLW